MPPAPSDDAGTFDPLAIIESLNQHEVEFIVIGGFAAGVQGAQWLTFDLDIVYSRDSENLRRLADALRELEAVPVDLPADVQVTVDRRALAAGDIWTLRTHYGRLDLMSEPAPGLTYTALLPRASEFRGQWWRRKLTNRR